MLQFSGRHGERLGGEQVEKKFLADIDLDMVADKEVDKLAEMMAGHGCWLIGPKLFQSEP